MQLLFEAKDDLEKNVSEQNCEILFSELEDSQSYAIEIGNQIERIEGEGTKTVGLLEQYCEVLFEIYQRISENLNSDIEVPIKRMSNLLELIRQSIENDIPLRKEIVFLPYKASMWDSLESIWEEVSRNDNYDVFVVPIPYYDKNSDGTMGTLHYEGEQYPSNVTITKYDAYDFENRRPDVIYIHNPYDNCNLVTSVHPFFYAKNIKKYTEKLVYVPYFVLDEINPHNRFAVKSIEHFCLVPGVIHADKVIVQSENMRFAYIEALTEAVGEESRDVWEQKIEGTGSPKFDKVKKTTRGTIELPEEWKQKMYRHDGSRKKVILYNNSVGAFLDTRSLMLEKIENVLAFFKKNTEQVTLLWRPHPLMKATIASMEPAMQQAYRALEEAFQRENWGIYDDSPDLNRAIALCDAYYGDQSSLVSLCRSVGKPVMIQNVYVKYEI